VITGDSRGERTAQVDQGQGNAFTGISGMKKTGVSRPIGRGWGGEKVKIR